MQMLSLLAALAPEAVVTFDNGMVGCITKGGKLALIDMSGVTVKPQYMPLVDEYCSVNSPIMIEHSFKVNDDCHLETVWVDDEWDFENKRWDFDGLAFDTELFDIEHKLVEALSNCRVNEMRLAA